MQTKTWRDLYKTFKTGDAQQQQAFLNENTISDLAKANAALFAASKDNFSVLEQLIHAGASIHAAE